MSYTTQVPTPTISANGYVAPPDSAILAGVTLDINTAFGGNLNFENLETPQGQLATTRAAIISDMFAQFCYYVTQIDPQFAAGRMQDGIGRIYFISRLPATPTVVQELCVGAPGTVIPVGALIVDSQNNLYSCTEAGTITTTGTISSVTLPFACNSTGPVVCAEGSTSIYQTIPGWDSATNPADGVLGDYVETRAAFELRRQNTVSGNSQASVDAMLGAVYAVPGVSQARVVDNSQDTPQTVQGVTLAANSVYAVVVGGAASDIALALWQKKPPGSAWNGGTTQVVTDTNPLLSTPYPTYTVKFDYAATQNIYVAVTLANTPSVPQNALALIQAAVIAAFAGTDGGPLLGIASVIYASRFYAGVQAIGQVNIISIYVGTSASPTGNLVTLNLNQAPGIASGQITLTLV